jgi:hypothetical protein
MGGGGGSHYGNRVRTVFANIGKTLDYGLVIITVV